MQRNSILLSSSIAKASALAAGEEFYFTGRPCKRGHVCSRRTSSSICAKPVLKLFLFAFNSPLSFAMLTNFPHVISREPDNVTNHCVRGLVLAAFPSGNRIGVSSKSRGKFTLRLAQCFTSVFYQFRKVHRAPVTMHKLLGLSLPQTLHLNVCNSPLDALISLGQSGSPAAQ